MAQSRWKAICQVSSKLKYTCTYDATIPLLGIYPQIKDLYVNVHISFIFLAQNQKETTQISNKKILAYTYNGTLLSNKKEWPLMHYNKDESQNNYSVWKEPDKEKNTFCSIQFI